MSGATPLGSPSTALFTRVSINSEKKHFIFICVCVSVCLSVRTYQGGSHSTDCGETWYWKLLRKYVAKFRVWLQSDTWHVLNFCLDWVSYWWLREVGFSSWYLYLQPITQQQPVCPLSVSPGVLGSTQRLSQVLELTLCTALREVCYWCRQNLWKSCHPAVNYQLLHHSVVSKATLK